MFHLLFLSNKMERKVNRFLRCFLACNYVIVYLRFMMSNTIAVSQEQNCLNLEILFSIPKSKKKEMIRYDKKEHGFWDMRKQFS